MLEWQRWRLSLRNACEKGLTVSCWGRDGSREPGQGSLADGRVVFPWGPKGAIGGFTQPAAHSQSLLLVCAWCIQTHTSPCMDACMDACMHATMMPLCSPSWYKKSCSHIPQLFSMLCRYGDSLVQVTWSWIYNLLFIFTQGLPKTKQLSISSLIAFKYLTVRSKCVRCQLFGGKKLRNWIHNRK